MVKNLIGDKKVGLVLGSGSAKGLTHIGVIKFLEEMDIKVDYIAGSSIGALIGGAYAAGGIKEIENLALQTDLTSTIKYLLPTISKSGLVSGTKVKEFIQEIVGDCSIENLDIPFIATATNIITGQEVDFDKGNLVEAIRASISIPIIFQPVIHENQILVDGGLSNPLPINIVRKMGADFIIAVNVIPSFDNINSTILQENNKQPLSTEMKTIMMKKLEWLNIDHNWIKKIFTGKNKYNVPSLKKVFNQSVNISQRKLSQYSIELYKPDVLIEPPVNSISLFDFYKAEEIINIGYETIKKYFYDNNLFE